MTNKEILEKAIQKAIDGGWNGGGKETEVTFDYDDYDGYRVHIMTYQGGHLQSFIYTADEEIIFNHDFAKALWGEDKNTRTTHDIKIDNGRRMNKGGWQPDWQYHLQQMVIAEDPIKYLGEHIDN